MLPQGGRPGLPQIRPFKALRYNTKKIKGLSLVVAPPYDIIPPAMQEKLYAKHPYNFVRLELGRINPSDDGSDNRYTRAGKSFNAWLKEKVLISDEKPAVYIYSQKYKYNKKYIERFGFLALMGLETGGTDRVLPHENTLAAPKTDRLNIMRAVRGNLSPIFVLYEDRPHKILGIFKKFCSAVKPIIDISFEGVRNRVWKLEDGRLIKRIESVMRGKDIFIADGHHRYEVARMYSDEIQDKDLPAELKKNSKYMMAYFVEADEKMLTILPAHRLVKDIGSLTKDETRERLAKFFHVGKAASLSAMISKLGRMSSSYAFGMYLGKHKFYILKLKSAKRSDAAIKDKPKDWKRLDVSILHLFILQHVLGIRDVDENVEFVKDPQDVIPMVDSGKFKIAFFLNSTKAWQVRRIAKLGERMPRKATYFYPKPLSGLVINRFTD